MKKETYQHIVEVKYPSSVVHVLSTWMAFGGNTRDLGSFGKETDEMTTLHQTSEVLKDGVRNIVMASERNRLKEALEESAEQRRSGIGTEKMRKNGYIQQIRIMKGLRRNWHNGLCPTKTVRASYGQLNQGTSLSNVRRARYVELLLLLWFWKTLSNNIT
ncbi:hypothetical protein Tco_1538697 [Tanacetum coccineum]